MDDDRRWKEIRGDKFEMIDVNLIKPDLIFSRDSTPTKDVGTTVDKTTILV